jgi:hypothetical protein
MDDRPTVPQITTEPPTAMAAPRAVPARVVVDAVEQAMAPGMTLGVAVLNVSTGELVEGGNAQEPLYAASLSKLILVVDMLDRRRLDGLTIAESDLTLVGRALTSSDDGAMNLLWGTYDGPGAISRVATRLGLTATTTPDDPSQWGETLVAAGDLARTYQHILRDMPAEDRGTIVNALAVTEPIAADGFDQFFGLLAQGASEERYAKQGWVSYRPQRLFLHSAGVVRDGRTGHDHAVVLLSVQNSASGTRTAQDGLSTVATAAIDALGG